MTVAFNAAANFNRADEMYMPKFPISFGMIPVSGFNGIGGNIGCGRNGEINFTKLNADNIAMQGSAEDLADAVISNDSKRTLKNWDRFKEIYMSTEEFKRLAHAFPNKEIPPKYLNEMLAKKFEQMTGQNYRALVKEHGNSNFVAAFKNGMTFGLWQKLSADKILDKTVGSKQNYSNRIVRGLGSIAGGAAVGAAIGSIIPGVGTAIGAGVGAVCGLISRLWS